MREKKLTILMPGMFNRHVFWPPRQVHAYECRNMLVVIDAPEIYGKWKTKDGRAENKCDHHSDGRKYEIVKMGNRRKSERTLSFQNRHPGA